MLRRLLEKFKSVESEVLECHQNKLPHMIGVHYDFDKKRKKYFARIEIDDRDVLFTEAKTREKLELNVNDAVATYYEIPSRYFDLLTFNKKLYHDPELAKKEKVLKLA